MQATVYVASEAYETAMMVKDMDYFERYDDESLAARPGYYLKPASRLKLAVLPRHSTVLPVAPVVPDDTVSSVECVGPIVTLPTNLRGCIFEFAPDLPVGYAEIVAYWSGPTVNTSSSGAVYFQCPLNEYMVSLGPEPVDAPVVIDRLLSEGVVVAITGILSLLSHLTDETFLEVSFPIDEVMLGVEAQALMAGAEYGPGAVRSDQIYLRVSDILASPDPDRVFIDLLRHELLDYGYYY